MSTCKVAVATADENECETRANKSTDEALHADFATYYAFQVVLTFHF